MRGGIGLAVAALAVAVLGCGAPVAPSASVAGSQPPSQGPAAASSSASDSPVSASPAPPPGHELYGFVPYWEMDATIAAHIATTPLTTLALFSVTNTAKGAISTNEPGYQAITGSVGSAMIAAAHGRGTRVDLVFTSFGASRNRSFFGRLGLQDATIASLVAFVAKLGVDGVDVDVESIDLDLVDAYGAFVGRLRTALVAAKPDSTVSVATGPGPTGAAMASAALAAGADRVFLMGYDYRTAGSEPGAVAPIARSDGGRSLSWSLDLYAAVGIAPQRLLLGLPLYGMAWPVIGPGLDMPGTGDGSLWILRRHLDVLTSDAVPLNDPLEAVDVYVLGADGQPAPPSAEAMLPGASGSATWTAAYVDTPTTLALKLGLGEARGLAGAGFWAIGYERGLPAYTDLMARFVGGQVPASS